MAWQALVVRSRSAGTVEVLCTIPPAWERVCSTTPHWELTGLEQVNTSARMFAACTEAQGNPPDPLRGMLLAGHCVEPSQAASGSGGQASASAVSLNAEQHAMVAEMCEGAERPACSGLHVLWGPPGTGKTTTLVHCIRAIVGTGRRVVVCAPSNKAVHELFERCHAMSSAM